MRGNVWVLRLGHENKDYTSEAAAARLVERWTTQNQQPRKQAVAVEKVVQLSGPGMKLRWKHHVKYNAVKAWTNPKLREAGYDPATCEVTVVEELTGCSAPQASQQELPSGSEGRPEQPRKELRKRSRSAKGAEQQRPPRPSGSSAARPATKESKAGRCAPSVEDAAKDRRGLRGAFRPVCAEEAAAQSQRARRCGRCAPPCSRIFLG